VTEALAFWCAHWLSIENLVLKKAYGQLLIFKNYNEGIYKVVVINSQAIDPHFHLHDKTLCLYKYYPVEKTFQD
jgi:hypothetical protein